MVYAVVGASRESGIPLIPFEIVSAPSGFDLWEKIYGNISLLTSLSRFYK